MCDWQQNSSVLHFHAGKYILETGHFTHCTLPFSRPTCPWSVWLISTSHTPLLFPLLPLVTSPRPFSFFHLSLTSMYSPPTPNHHQKKKIQNQTVEAQALPQTRKHAKWSRRLHTSTHTYTHSNTHSCHVMCVVSWGPDEWNLSVGSRYTEHHRGFLSSQNSTKPQSRSAVLFTHTPRSIHKHAGTNATDWKKKKGRGGIQSMYTKPLNPPSLSTCTLVHVDMWATHIPPALSKKKITILFISKT